MPAYNTLINADYFKGEITISQIENVAKRAVVTDFIMKNEPHFLLQLMGKDLFNAFYAGIKSNTPLQKWKDMAYGKYFKATNAQCSCFNAEGRMINFTGLMSNPTGEEDIDYTNFRVGSNSPIANYIYYWFQRNAATIPGGIGESVQQSHNGITVSAGQKMADAYNRMCDQVYNFYLFLDTYKADYPEFNLECEDRFIPKKINYPFNWA